MFNSIFFCAACALNWSLVKAANVDMCVGDVCAKILGQSGKIDFFFDDQTIQVTMDSIVEVDSSGNMVGNTGSDKHSFNSFASQEFVFSELYDTTYQNLSATAVNFTSSLVDATSIFDVQLYLFLEDGVIENHNRSYAVSRGSFKFSYNWDYWPFCTIGGSGVTQCTKGGTDQEGAFLDFKIILKGNSDAAIDTNGTLLYTDNSKVYMPKDYYASEWEVMPDGYPMEVLQGSKTEVTFRFARFGEALDYDPILNWGTGDIDNSGAASRAPVFAITFLSAIIALVLSLQ
jgi:hypothetical protein